MSGAYGYGSLMVRKNNKQNATRKKRIETYKNKLRIHSEEKAKLEFKKISKEELAVIKLKIQKRIKEERLKYRYQFAVIILTIFILFSYFLFVKSIVTIVGILIFITMTTIFINMKKS